MLRYPFRMLGRAVATTLTHGPSRPRLKRSDHRSGPPVDPDLKNTRDKADSSDLRESFCEEAQERLSGRGGDLGSGIASTMHFVAVKTGDRHARRWLFRTRAPPGASADTDHLAGVLPRLRIQAHPRLAQLAPSVCPVLRRNVARLPPVVVVSAPFHCLPCPTDAPSLLGMSTDLDAVREGALQVLKDSPTHFPSYVRSTLAPALRAALHVPCMEIQAKHAMES